MNLAAAFRGVINSLEQKLFLERDQLALWLPVALGGGIAAWFALPGAPAWVAWIAAAGGLGAAGFAAGAGGRIGRAMLVAGLLAAIGCALVWARAEWRTAPVLGRPTVTTVTGTIERAQPLPARDAVRLTLATGGTDGLPPRVRISVPEDQAVPMFRVGERVTARARLVPPPSAAVPGAYDYARVAWFDGIGGTGSVLGDITRLSPPGAGTLPTRDRLSAHIRAQLPAAEGGIAAALATGDQGAIPDEDAEAMRRSGLAHLLSISGLHITAMFAGVSLLVLRLLALSPWLALRAPLLLVATAAGALAACGYTWLSGAEIPTIRSLVAALLIALAIALGREAVTLRLVAAGALIVLLLWPEAIAGPSFQLSFAAITAIVALHEHPRVRSWFERREEGRGMRLLRGLASLLLTGLVVEIALSPIALFHFHRSGLYGALANIVAIPWTTFVTMPLEAAALILDGIGALIGIEGMGTPAWWLTGQSLSLLLWLAHAVANAPGSVTALPVAPRAALALAVVGGLWMGLWKSRWRWWGAVPAAVGMLWMAFAPTPDLLVTGDGRHLALIDLDGRPALLRARAGDYVRQTLSETAGYDGEPTALEELPGARCNADLCTVDIVRGGGAWRLLATRSTYAVPVEEMVAACAAADIVVSERWLPRRCTPRWLKLDRNLLARTGGVAIYLGQRRAVTVADANGAHPWGVRAPVDAGPPRPCGHGWGRAC